MNLSQRLAVGITVAVMLASGAAAHAEESDMLLFKVVSVKDEVIIGLTEGQLTEAGGLNAGVVGKLLSDNGELAAWQYVVSRNDAGEPVEAPTNMISILAHGTLRVEPYQSALPVTLPIGE